MEPHHKRSRENRGSKRSIRSSTGSTIDTAQAEVTNALVEKKRLMVLEEEQKQLIIYSVREELIQRVMQECHTRYMEKQCVNFTVHCAYRALVQIVNLGLHHHDLGKPFYKGHLAWLDDKPPVPSPADSWAVGQVAIKRKAIPKLLEPIPNKEILHTDERQLENVFTGIEIAKEEITPEEEEIDVEVIYRAENEQTEGESESNLLVPPVTEVTLAAEEERHISIEEVHPLSIFTQTTQMPQEYLPHSMKSARSKLKGLVTKIIQHPVLNLDEMCSTKSKLSVSGLPPLRSNTNYKHVPKTKEGEREADEISSEIQD